MAPPQLAGDTPILDVFEPLVVSGRPVLRKELDIAARDDVKRDFGDALARMQRAVGRGLAHRDEPLIREHGLQDFASAIAPRLHHLVRLDLDEVAERFKRGHDGVACGDAIHATKLCRRIFVDVRVEREDLDQGQIVAGCARIVVEIVRAGDLDAARAERAVDEVVGDDGDATVAQGQLDHLADQVAVADIVGMHGNRVVAQHRFRAGGCNRHAVDRRRHTLVVGDGLRAVGKWVADMPQVSVGFD